MQSLQNKRVLSLDLAAIMVGSGIRGAFEEKFKALIRDIEEEVRSSKWLLLESFDLSILPGWQCNLLH